MAAKNIHGLAAAVASVASVAMLGALCVAPATALSDVDLDGASVAAASGATTGAANAAASGSQLSQLKAQTVADASSDSAAMPDNPDAALPSQVAADIPDDATVVSEDHAVTDEGELKDIETGETVTDEKLVGTKDSQPDPLAKTDGESFIPVSADEVKQKVADNGGDVNATVEGGAADQSGDATNGDADANAGTDGSANDSANGGQDTANGDQNVADGLAKTSASKSKKTDTKDAATKSTVKLAALQNGEYGAHWGSYNGTAAFFDANNNLFAQQAKGVIDVSAWQGDIDWQAAKNAGVEGAIIRISYGWGNGFDTKALRNISECKRLGIPFGVYSYSYSYDAGTATEEGKDIVSLLRQAGVNPGDLSYPVFYDLEKWSWTGHTPPTSPSVYDGIVNAWYGQLQAAGYNNLSVYSYTSYLNGPLNSGNIHGKTRWVAQYGATMQYTAFPTNDRGWQYTSSGKVNGISGSVDVNAFGTKTYQAGTDVRTMDKVSIPNGTYYINSTKKNDSGIEIAGGGTANGAKTQLYAANATKAQQFTFTKQSDGSYVIANANSGKVLDVAGGQAKLNATVQQYDANGSTAQKWFIRDSGSGWYLQSALGNWVLDIAGGSTASGTSVSLYAPNGSSAQKFVTASVGTNLPIDTTVRVRSAKNNGIVIDIAGASTANGARAQLYGWNGTNAQLFRLKQVSVNGVYRIVNSRSGKALEVAGAKAGNGAAIQQYAVNGTAAQHWSVIGSGDKLTFLNGNSAKAIDVPGGNVASGVALQAYGTNGTAAQQWQVTKEKTLRDRLDEQATANKSVIADGTYRIVSSAKGSMVVDVSGGSKANGANVQLYANNGSKAQQWKVSHDAKGYVTLTNIGSGKVLDVSGGSTANGANIQQYAGNSSWAQKWIAVKNANGTITFRSAAAENRVIDVAAGSTANGANVQLYASNGSKAQQWVLK